MIRISRILVLATLVFAACSTEDDSNGGGNSNDNFDRGAMLANWADNVIVPSFENFQSETQKLEAAAKNFAANPEMSELEALRAQYEDAYLEFQTVSMFQIGKAEELNYRNFLNTYPVNESSLESKIASGEYNLSLPSSFTEQGFPALDYLLYGYGSAEATLEKLGGNENYSNYLVAISERINALTSEVTASWQGDFRDTFVNNTGSSSTGSVDRFTNDYVMYFEKILRSGKIGYPSGALTGTPSPGNAEALYAGISKELYLKAFNSFEDFYKGKTGPSYSQYLDYLGSMKDGSDLDALIRDQFEAIKAQSADLNNNLKSQVESDNTKMLTAFDELQKAVILLKVDMMQSLSTSVDYVDSDGD
ncbi:imelysin family protein [Pontixanthobacter gangjinensis]|uniref:Imelysin family protein n=1 Tax=Christiangramia aestuarii TaxID=1028746 RepID=A0A7M3SXV1_9FLAO|nr:imelysin family protein [Christiangramia aestuarii]MUP41432.1 imelysin family protein [Christiangramia aestuarii]